MGEERLIELLKLQNLPARRRADVYMVTLGQDSELSGLQLAEHIRDHLPQLALQNNMGGGSFKSQFKRADRSGAAYALILAENELTTSSITIKPLRGQGAQQTIPLSELINWLTENLPG